jgi:AmmeMemoRadiSam system protein A
MCGGGPAVSVIKTAIDMGANKVKILKYGDSGDISGDKSSVVSYLAAVIYDSKNNAIGKKEDESNPEPLDKDELPKQFGLSKSDKNELLNIARRSIENYLATGEIPDFEVSEHLNKFGAAFVTLEKQGRLRGCIGHTTAVEPLYKTVSGCAVQAAVNDRRFPPVKAGELSEIHIEISVLSSLQTVESFDEIKVGRDGLMIFKGNRRGLLLPQVATDYGWDRKTFLEQTCRKAGLQTDDYKSADAVVYKFQAEIFGE